jgi:D-alanyl-D-alanine carboxypeptidase
MLPRYLVLALIAAGSASFPVKARVAATRHTHALIPSRPPAARKHAPAQTDALPARDRIDRLIERQERSGQKVALAVMSLAGDSLIESWHAIDPMTPASNLKILALAAGWQYWDGNLVAAMRRKLGRRAFLHASLRPPTFGRQPPARRRRAAFPGRTGPTVPTSVSGEVPDPDSLNRTFPESDTLSGLQGFDLLCRIGKLSDNYVANALMDCLTERLSRSRLEVVGDYLEQNHIWSGGLNAEDGSGRSPQDRTTALTLAQTLGWFWRVQGRDAFVRCLSVAGEDGTLRRHDLALGSRVRAKTGSIAGTFSLSGYLARPDDTLAFSIVLNQCFDKKSAFGFFADVLGTL